jgi:hypothetical protein
MPSSGEDEKKNFTRDERWTARPMFMIVAVVCVLVVFVYLMLKR